MSSSTSTTAYRHIRGVLLEDPSENAIEGAVVIATLELLRSGRLTPRELARGRTASDGSFVLQLPAAVFDEGRGTIKFSVQTADGDAYVHAEHSRSSFAPERLPFDLVLCVEKLEFCSIADPLSPPGAGAGQRSVYGRVLHADGTPISGLEIEASRAKVAGVTALTPKDTTDSNGEYSIVFSDGGDTTNPWHIFVEASEISPVKLVGKSEVFLNTATETQIDLRLTDDAYRELSEYGLIQPDVEAGRDTTTYPALTPKQTALIAREYEYDLAHVARYVLAMRACLKMQLTTHLDGAGPADRAEQIYGLIRVGWPAHVPGILGRDRGTLEADLCRAADANIISREAADDFSTLADDLKGASVAVALGTSTPGSLGNLLATTSLTGPKRKSLLNAWRDHTSDTATFWSDVRAGTIGGLTPSETDEAERAVRLGILTQNNPALVAEIEDTISGGLSDVAKWTQSAWATAISNAGGAPEWIEGASPAAKDANYEQMMLDRSELAWPDVRYRARVDASSGVLSSATVTWLGNNLGANLAEGPFALDGSTEMSELRALQRLYRIAPPTGRAEAMLEVFGQGYTSSYEIVSGGRARFVAAMDTHLDAATAQQVFANAQTAYGASLMLLMQHHPNLATSPLPSVEDLDTSSIPTALHEYSDLFGGLSTCTCSTCRSVHSPSAYFVSLMEWIRVRGGLTEASNEWSLNGSRREDLGKLRIHCKNAETVLPYIDLVTEILEDAVAGTTVDRSNSSWSSDEVAITPEYPNTASYDLLRDSEWPPPFDYYDEVQRVFSDHLGIPRNQLWAQWEGSGAATSTSADDVARARLGLDAKAAQLIANDPATSEENYWGVSAGGWETTVTAVDEFIDRLGITFEEAEELLRCQSSGAVALGTGWERQLQLQAGGGDPCDIADWDVRTPGDGVPSDTQLRGLARFVRLWRATGWSIRDLDAVLVSIGVEDVEGTPGLDGDALQKVAAVVELERRLRVPAVELVTLWGDVPVYEGPEGEERTFEPYYDRLFLSPLLAPGAPAGPFELNGNRTDVDSPPTFENVIDLLVGGTREARDELVFAATEWSTLPALDLSTLSTLLRRVQLARLLGWRAVDVYLYLQTAGTTGGAADPFAANDPRQTLAFVDQVSPLVRASLSGATWSYLLRHDSLAAEEAGATPDALRALVGQVREATRSTLAGSAQDPSQNRRREAVVNALSGVFATSDASVRDLLERADSIPGVNAAMALSSPQFLAGGGAPVDGEPFGDLDPDLVRDAGAFEALERLHKCILLLRATDASLAEQVGWLDQAWSGSELPDPLALSVGATADSVPTVPELDEQYRALLHWFGARSFAPTAELDRLIIGPVAEGLDPAPSAADLVAELGGWTADDVQAVLDSLGLVELSGIGLERTLRILGWADRAGTTGAEVVGWIDLSTAGAEDLANSLISVARGRHGELSSWLEVARPLRDALRESLRKALVAYVLADNANLETEEDLYGEYLMDPLMGPWLQTTRIKAAAGALQIYVQRALLGLESNFALDEDDARQWTWMKNYRVWEAARKVFLYPENWIEPELRDDKTPFFTQLEQELGQDRLTEEHIDTVYLNYLERLDEVHELHVLSCYHELWRDDDGVARERFHIVGRTRSHPYTYWYRTRDGRGVFSPWAKIDCGLEGDHVQVYVYESRVLLVWAAFEDGQGEYSSNCSLSWSQRTPSGWAPRSTSRTVAEVNDDPAILSLRIGLSTEADLDDEHVDQVGALIIDLGRASGSLPVEETKTAYGRWTLETCTGELLGEANGSSNQYAEDDPVFLPAAQGFSTVVYRGLSAAVVVEPDSDLPQSQVAEVRDLIPLTRRLVHRTRMVHERGLRAFAFDRPYLVEIHESREDGSSNPPEATALHQYVVSRTDVPLESLLVADAAGFESIPKVPEKEAPASETLDVEIDTGDLGDLYASGAPEVTSRLGEEANAPFAFELHHHPWSCTFGEEVWRNGALALVDPGPNALPGLLRQQLSVDSFETDLDPTDNVATPYPIGDVDFSRRGAYSQYNWELFFHGPLTIASRLATNQRYDLALRWIRTIFDPFDPDTGTDPANYWRVRPLFEEDAQAPITDWATFTGASVGTEFESFTAQVEEWMDDPFNPHLIARMRPGTYKRFVILRMLDILIAWGDQLFRRDTMESIQEATQLYLMAQEMLGDRPVELPETAAPAPLSYNQLQNIGVDDFGNVVANVEVLLPQLNGNASPPGQSPPDLGAMLSYFCIPVNPKLVGYWDTVEDRLFKLRTGLNIDGIRRSLPLYQPPIDPALLVRARAMGLDLATVLGDLALPLPKYRFTVMLGRAQSLCGTVRSLGAALLSALEKQDAEQLSRLRSTHEVAVLGAVKETRRLQVKEARAALAGLEGTVQQVSQRRDYYQGLLATGDLPAEIAQVVNTTVAGVLSGAAGVLRGISSIVSGIPQIHSPPSASVETGGQQLGGLIGGIAGFIEAGATGHRLASELNAITAGRLRRDQEWEFQIAQAEAELKQLEKQVLAAEIRVDIAERELAIQDQQVDNAREVELFLRSKFTNQELYSWMVGQTSTLYFQTYQLAYDLAKQAQRCYQHEMGDEGASYVQFGHWDSLHKGLLAGERLGLDLDRMDAAYLNADIREREITRHISLDRLDPAQLLQLRLTGECTIEIPEWLLDMDFPGHYFRRIKSVGLTIASVVGREQGVNAELTLLKAYRRESLSAAFSESDYRWAGQHGDNVNETVAISGATDDSGTFQVDFTGPRYMPFERKGAVSQWRLTLTGYPAQMDWAQIADVVMHLRYTARSNEAARSAVRGAVDKVLDGTFSSGSIAGVGLRALSLARDLPDLWYQVSQAPATAFDVTLLAKHLPYGHAAKTASITAVGAWLVGPDAVGNPAETLAIDGGTAENFALVGSDLFSGLSASVEGLSVALGTSIEVTLANAVSTDLDDIVIIFEYTVS